MRGIRGSTTHFSKRQQYIDAKGYLAIRTKSGEKRVHRLIVEEVLGKRLPKCATVHHIDGNKLNNAKSNLVVLQNNAEHKRVHALQRLISLGCVLGQTHFCYRCRRVLPVGNFCKNKRYPTGLDQICKGCRREADLAAKETSDE